MIESGWPTMSDEVGEIAAALAVAQSQIDPAIKGSENPFLKNKFADLNSVIDVVRPALSNSGIAFPQIIDKIDGIEYVVTMLIHTGSGQWIRSRIPLTCEESKGTNRNQAMGIAITYARRYALTAICGVTQEDNDAATAAPSNKAKEKERMLETQRQQQLKNVLARLKRRWPNETAEYSADLLMDRAHLTGPNGKGAARQGLLSAKGEEAEEICALLTDFGVRMKQEEQEEEALNGSAAQSEVVLETAEN
tara:strand:- start:2116 stop:2865 length:750 start_codon:yes stop_codon:yes gene_type:complete